MSIHTVSGVFESKGIRANQHKEFAVTFTGDRWYKLLARAEKRAEESREFEEISQLVSDVLEIRRQLKVHGF